MIAACLVGCRTALAASRSRRKESRKIVHSDANAQIQWQIVPSLGQLKLAASKEFWLQVGPLYTLCNSYQFEVSSFRPVEHRREVLSSQDGTSDSQTAACVAGG